MKLFDTDHLSVLLDARHQLHAQLVARLETTTDVVALPVVVVEEHLRGWLAQIRRVAEVHKQIVPYLRLHKFITFARNWDLVDWNEPAADAFVRLRSRRVRIGTQDLKIASIALANQATLLTSNLQDFEQIPGLAIEDWLYGT